MLKKSTIKKKEVSNDLIFASLEYLNKIMKGEGPEALILELLRNDLEICAN